MHHEVAIFSFLHMSVCFADVVRSAIGFTIFSVVLVTWATTFVVGGERLFGPVWNDLVMYNVADKLGISGFMG